MPGPLAASVLAPLARRLLAACSSLLVDMRGRTAETACRARRTSPAAARWPEAPQAPQAPEALNSSAFCVASHAHLYRGSARATRPSLADSALARTPLYAEHVRLGGKLVPFAGWEMPIQYQGISAEHAAVRERVGLFDVSHMGELVITGPHAVEVVDSLITNHLGKARDGQAVYTCCCNDSGLILDDLIVYRCSER